MGSQSCDHAHHRLPHGDHAILRRLAVKLVPYHSLRYPEFVDYYFTGSPSCQLKILVDQDESAAGRAGSGADELRDAGG